MQQYHTIELDGIVYSVNGEDKTAKITCCKSIETEIIIPRSIIYGKTEYTIISILEKSFFKSPIKSIQFPYDSMLQTIEKNAFSESSIEKLFIPSSVIDLKGGWCSVAKNLKHITISPKNPKYSLFDNKFIIGKSQIERDEYDVILFCFKDINILNLPTFIKVIESHSFCNCQKLNKIKIAFDSNLQKIEKDAFSCSLNEIIFEEQIDKYIEKPTKRHSRTPEFVYINGETYTFQNYNINGIVYNCIYGKDRHIKLRCHAQILVSFRIHFTSDWEENVIFCNSIHSYHPTTAVAQIPYFSENQIAEQIETIYLSNKPRFGRYKTYNLLLQYIKDNTPQNAGRTIVSKTFFNNIYNKLDEQNQPKEKIELFRNLRNENFELFNNNFIDNNSGQIFSIRCYSSPFQLSMIPKSSIIEIDCTFQTTPIEYKQVMVIMGKTDTMNLPLSYMLLPSKHEKIYKMALSIYKTYITNFHKNVTFICDFEHAEINAIKSELFSNGNFFQLCFFHYVKALKHFFSNNLKEFVNTENALKEQNLKDNPNFNFENRIEIKKRINKMIKKLAKMFPFIEHRKVYSAIEILKGFSQTKEFAKYFKDTYLTKYSIEDWSTFGKIDTLNITNNIVERHNRKLNSLFAHPHPTLDEFQQQIAILENEYFNMYDNSKQQNEDAPHDDSKCKHYNEHDFDVHFNELKSYLLNHATQLQKEFAEGPKNDSTNSTKIKDLPSTTLQILKNSCQQFFGLPPHSQERRKLLEDVEKQINNPNIKINKIRMWFNNNRESIES